jgi:hypothetical protein
MPPHAPEPVPSIDPIAEALKAHRQERQINWQDDYIPCDEGEDNILMSLIAACVLAGIGSGACVYLLVASFFL